MGAIVLLLSIIWEFWEWLFLVSIHFATQPASLMQGICGDDILFGDGICSAEIKKNKSFFVQKSVKMHKSNGSNSKDFCLKYLT